MAESNASVGDMESSDETGESEHEDEDLNEMEKILDLNHIEFAQNVDANKEPFNIEDFDDLSSDDELAERIVAAGFTKGLTPTTAELALLRGTTFKEWKAYDKALHEYEGTSGMTLQRLKKRKYAARAICRGFRRGDENACKVEISSRCPEKTGIITIRKVYLVHTCATPIHAFRNGANKTSWVAGKLQDQVRINPGTSMKHLNEHLRNYHSASSKMWTVQRARAQCRENLGGGSKESFQKIPAYIELINRVDPDAHAFVQTGEGRRFARLYIAPASSRIVARHCRPLVGLDGTHTVGKFPMVVLLATCFDGENHIVILAWAVVKVENGDNWLWFLEHFRTSYPNFKQRSIVFISDRDKGLLKSVSTSFPDAHHCHCVQHIRANIKGQMDVHCSNLFKKVAVARTKAEYEELLTSFVPSSERQEKFIPYVRNIHPEVYARHAVPVPRYGHNTSNVVEIINAAIKPARVMPALRLSEYIWNYVMQQHCQRLEHAKQLPEGPIQLTQYANNMFVRLYRDSRGMKELRSSESQSLIVDSVGSWAVRVNDCFCDCGEWKEMDFPCAHAICLLSNRQQDPREFVGKVWLANNQVQAYLCPLPPFSIDHLEQSMDSCYAPLFEEKTRFRKATKRAPSWGEQQARNNDRLVRKQSHRCGVCRQVGHNKRHCTAGPPPNVAAPGASSWVAESHESLRVGAVHIAHRLPQADWSYFHTRSNTQSFTEYIASQDEAQTGASQVTQDH